MKDLLLLLPFAIFFGGIWLIDQLRNSVSSWWFMPLLLTLMIAFVVSFFIAQDVIDEG